MGRQLLLIVIAIVHGVRSLYPSSTQQRRGTSTTALHLNRIFCELNEVTDDDHLHFPKDDYRFDHIIDILRLKAGDTLKVGVLDVGKTDAAEVRSMSEHAITVALGPRAGWATNARPRVDLILAVPRPLRLERILPVVSCVGVGRLVLIGASKVQADYFGSHLFRRPEELRKGLVEGLSQAASDCLVPDVLVRRNLKKWLSSPEFDDMFPSDTYQKVFVVGPFAAHAVCLTSALLISCCVLAGCRAPPVRHIAGAATTTHRRSAQGKETDGGATGRGLNTHTHARQPTAPSCARAGRWPGVGRGRGSSHCGGGGAGGRLGGRRGADARGQGSPRHCPPRVSFPPPA